MPLLFSYVIATASAQILICKKVQQSDQCHAPLQNIYKLKLIIDNGTIELYGHTHILSLSHGSLLYILKVATCQGRTIKL